MLGLREKKGRNAGKKLLQLKYISFSQMPKLILSVCTHAKHERFNKNGTFYSVFVVHLFDSYILSSLIIK